MPLNATLLCRFSLLVAMVGSAGISVAAGDDLLTLEKHVQGCVETSQPQACAKANAQVRGLTLNRAYQISSHLCKEEISELSTVISLLPMRDAVPTEVMASVADVQQACQPYGF